MKKISIIFSVLILFSSSAFALKMDKVSFEHLVDYANCQYLMTFIEKHEIGKPYINDVYGKKIKPVLQTATLEKLNDVPPYSKIKDLFLNGSNNSALKLADIINQRKEKYKDCSDNNSLFQSLKLTGWESIDLKETANIITDNCNTTLNKSSVPSNSPDVEQNTENDQNFQQYSELNKKIDSMKDTISTFKLLVLLCLGGFILLIVLMIWNKINYNTKKREIIKDVFLKSKTIQNKIKDEIQKSTHALSNSNIANNDVRMFEDKLNRLERQFGDLQSKFNSLKTTENKKNETQLVNQSIVQPVQKNADVLITKEIELYFTSKNEKQLTEPLSNSNNASFKVYAINDNDAKFEYIGSVRNENWFEGICTIENAANDNLSDKKQINTTQPGTVKKENNNWVVSKPAKIKFI